LVKVVTEFAVDQGIDNMPVFSWWASHVLEKRETIMSAVARWHHNQFGIKMPKTADAIRLEHANGNSLWMEAVTLKVTVIKVSVNCCTTGTRRLQGIICHCVFDVKLDGFRLP
jgi:hypothetical protein